MVQCERNNKQTNIKEFNNPALTVLTDFRRFFFFLNTTKKLQNPMRKCFTNSTYIRFLCLSD